MSEKIAVVSDIHGNADALAWALEDVRSESVDLTIVLGDLLTYGCQPLEVLDMLDAYSGECECIFIKGNHDQFYFDLFKGGSGQAFSYKLPDFVKESILWTEDMLGGLDLSAKYPWRESYSLGSVYFSHANPYAYGDWRYVDTQEQCLEAFSALVDLDAFVGVFGHSHRSRAVSFGGNGEIISLPSKSSVQFGLGDRVILNPGAIGQPRGEGLSYMVLSLFDNGIEFDIRPIEVDVSRSIALIKETPMSLLTKQKLTNYLES